ncbi:distal tail protein Dit [Salipaludibacillus sp. CF4.18]|uniref:distal tail protein Dit n=1 Tax=Salipaludibacillus sp. CF4.18 TaxID=3373081 RepID=UPI003EE72F63
MLKTIRFNGVEKPWLFIKKGKERPPFAPINRNTITTPGLKGAYINSSQTDVLRLSIPILIVRGDRDMEQIEEELASWLVTDEPAPLIYSDRSNKTYYAVFDGAINDFEDLVDSGEGTLHFICPDPHKYGQEQGPYHFQGDAITIHNEGTAEVDSVITATAKESVTSFMIAKGEQDYFMVGRPFDIDKEARDRYPEVNRWGMESLLGWSHMTSGFLLNDEVSGGTISGSDLEVLNGTSFVPVGFGSGYSGWYGPAVRQSLSAPVQDFKLVLGASALNDGNGVGKVMAIFLDENDDIVCSLGLINTRDGSRNIRVLARMNDGNNISRRRVMDYTGDSGPESTVFSGSLLNIELIREGNTFKARTWQVRDGVPVARHSETIIDDNPDYQRPIRQVVLFFAKYGSREIFPMRMYGLRVNESNLLTEDDIPYIAHEGDEIKIDTKNELIMINDDPATELKDFGSNYFTLDTGNNHLFTYPVGAFDTMIAWRPKYR